MRKAIVFIAMCTTSVLTGFLSYEINKKIKGSSDPSFILSYFPDQFETIYTYTLLQSLSIAILIAAILLVTLDSYKSSRLEKLVTDKSDDIARDVFGAVFSANLPTDIVDQAVKTVLNDPLYRDNFEAKFVLTRCQVGRGYVMGITISYDVVNNTLRKQYYDTTLKITGFESQAFADSTRLDSIRYRRPKDAGWRKAVEKKKKEKFNSDISNKKTIDNIVGTKVLRIEPKSRITIESAYQMWKAKDSNHIFRSKNAGTGFAVKFIDQTGENLEVDVTAIHSDPIQFIEDEESGSSHRVWRWVLNKPTLPHNGFVVFWRSGSS